MKRAARRPARARSARPAARTNGRAAPQPARTAARTRARPRPAARTPAAAARRSRPLAGAAAVEAGLDALAANTIRFLAVDAVEQAKSGHPGTPMGLADAAYVLWTRFLRYQPHDPGWPGRDRFVLSAGHASMLLYALLHLAGYDLPLEELRRFRQLGSRTPGHPEHGLTPGVETTTGPLGQGFGNGVGMAVAAQMLAARFNRADFAPVGWRVFGIVSDGDLMEGVASEAASLAGHWGLGNLIYLYDDNHITIEGDTALAFSEDVQGRFEAYGWQVQRADAHDRAAVAVALARAVAERARPTGSRSAPTRRAPRRPRWAGPSRRRSGSRRRCGGASRAAPPSWPPSTTPGTPGWRAGAAAIPIWRVPGTRTTASACRPTSSSG